MTELTEDSPDIEIAAELLAASYDDSNQFARSLARSYPRASAAVAAAARRLAAEGKLGPVPTRADAVPEGHVRVRIPVQRRRAGRLFIEAAARADNVEEWSMYSGYSGNHPVVAWVVADIPLPGEPPTVRGRVEE